jgi:molybdenum cofactor biosynthesis protein MoaC
MLSMPAMGSFGQARAYSSDSKDDDVPDIGLGFQSLGSLFPPPPAPGRYSQPRERRAEEAKSSVHEDRTPSEVSQQETAPPPASGRYSQPRDKKAEEEVTEKETTSLPVSGRYSQPRDRKAEEEATQKETMPPPKAPFFGSVASEQRNAPDQAQAGEPTGDAFTIRRIDNYYNWTEGKWQSRPNAEPHANEVARQKAGSLLVKHQDSVETLGSSSSRRERRLTQTTRKPKQPRTDKVARNTSRKPALNPVASKGRTVPPPAEPQPGKDAWGLSQEDQTITYSPAPAEPRNSESTDKESSKTATTTTAASPASRQLTHVRPTGEAHMVDVGAKTATKRTAIAVAHIRVSPELYKQIEENSNKKGDVLGIARIAGIMAAKRTSDIIPLCHPLALTKAEVDVYLVPGTRTSSVWHGHSRLVAIQALVECVGPTGVEMEALMAVQGAALTVVDMCKALDRGLTIDWAYVVYKAGGRSGVYVDAKWKYEVGREKFGPLDGRLVDGVGNADVLVRGRARSEMMTKTGRRSKKEVRKEEGGVSMERSAGVDL